MAKSFKEGDWVWHKTNGIGKVSLSSDSELLVEFEGGKDEIFDTAGKKRAPLVKLSPRGFHLRKRDEAEQFSKHINQEPLDAALALVEDQQAEITPAELKGLVCPALIAESEVCRMASAPRSGGEIPTRDLKWTSPARYRIRENLGRSRRNCSPASGSPPR